MPRKKFTPVPVAELLAYARERQDVAKALIRRRRELRAELEVIADSLLRLAVSPKEVAKLEAAMAIEEAEERAADQLKFRLGVLDEPETKPRRSAPQRRRHDRSEERNTDHAG